MSNIQQTSIPLKGLLREEGEGVDSAAIQLILAQQQQMLDQLKLQQQYLKTSQQAQEEQRNATAQLHREIARNKEVADRALRIVYERLLNLIQNQQPDPKATAEMIKLAQRDARKRTANKKGQFLIDLPNMPAGRLFNPDKEPVSLTINGVRKVFKPGWNDNVPEAYLVEWEKSQEALGRAEEMVQKMSWDADTGQIHTAAGLERIRAGFGAQANPDILNLGIEEQ